MADSFHEFVKELLAGLPGGVQIKRMFGGAGVYCGGLMFGLIAEDTIYLKADDALKAELKREGCGPFVWTPGTGLKAGQEIEMGYWRLPEDALDDPELAVQWARKALAVARAKAKDKKAKRAKAVHKKKSEKAKKTKR